MHHGDKCVCVDTWEWVKGVHVFVKMYRFCRVRSSECGAVFTVRVSVFMSMHGSGRKGCMFLLATQIMQDAK